MNQMLRPRRLLIALALAVTLGSLGVGALGTQTSSWGEIPATWSTAMPHQGDQGLYTYTQVDGQGNLLGPEVPYLVFEQTNASNTLNAAGQPVRAHQLMMTYGYYVGDYSSGDDQTVYTWELDSNRIGLAEGIDGSYPFVDLDFSSFLEMFETSNSTVDVAGVPVLDSSTSTDGTFLYRIYDQDIANPALFHFCGARTNLQGQDLTLNQPVVMAPCTFRIGGLDPERTRIVTDDDDGELDLPRPESRLHERGLTFRALGQQRLGDLETVAFTRVVDGEETNRRLIVWLAREVPYPVQWALETRDGLHVLRLTEFKRGGEPLPTASPTGQLTAPAFAMAPIQPWGMQDEGTTLAVPASRAWQAALEDGPLQTYVTAHPQAFVYSLSGDLYANAISGVQDFTWQFALSDGASAFAVDVTAQVDPLVPVPPILGLPVTSPPAEPRFSFDYPEARDAPRLDRSWLPPTWPTALSAIERWQAFTQSDRDDVPWGFDVVCTESVAGVLDSVFGADQQFASCTNYETRFSIGGTFLDARVDATGTPGRPEIEGSLDIQVAAFDRDGTAEALLHLGIDQTTTYVPAPFAPTQAAQPYAPPGDLDWALPDVALVAGVGAAAALFGALYLFWPALKALFVGGYARVTGQDVLDHPVRQRLMQAIEAQPGIHLKQVSRVAGLAWGQTQHHMRKLVDAGVVVARPSAGYTCYFPRGQHRYVMASAAVLKADGARRLFQAITSTTGLSMGQLSRMAGLTESTAHYHLRRLESAGLVTTQRIHGARRVMPTALGSEAGRVFASPSAAS